MRIDSQPFGCLLKMKAQKSQHLQRKSVQQSNLPSHISVLRLCNENQPRSKTRDQPLCKPANISSHAACLKPTSEISNLLPSFPSLPFFLSSIPCCLMSPPIFVFHSGNKTFTACFKTFLHISCLCLFCVYAVYVQVFFFLTTFNLWFSSLK